MPKYDRLKGAVLLVFFAILTGGSHAGVLDFFKSNGKKNDDWFVTNRQNITGQFTNLGYTTSTNTPTGQPEQLETLKGWCENRSDQQVSAVLFDIVVSQPNTGAEVLKERVWINMKVFKTERVNFACTLPSIERGSSQIFECLNRNTNCNWTGVLVVAVPYLDDVIRSSDRDVDLEKYYGVNSVWY